MLEYQGLLIGPWMAWRDLARAAKAGRLRRILQPATGLVLGFARSAAVHPWLGWLAAQTVQVAEKVPEPLSSELPTNVPGNVSESGDASLLMTIRRPWGPARAWSVVDADERPVGSIFRNVLLDSQDQRLARLVKSANPSPRPEGAPASPSPPPQGSPSSPSPPPRGRRVGVRGDQGVFLGSKGMELAAFANTDQGTVLTFNEITEGQPFTRMLLLGAVLSWD